MWLLRFGYQEKNGSMVCTLATQLTSLQRSTLHISDRKTGFLYICFQENVTIESESGLDMAEQRMLGDVPSDPTSCDPADHASKRDIINICESPHQNQLLLAGESRGHAKS